MAGDASSPDTGTDASSVADGETLESSVPPPLEFPLALAPDPLPDDDPLFPGVK